jgi:hypothetical protein
MAVFMTPFNVVMLALWSGAFYWRKQQRMLASGGVESSVRGSKIIVSLPRFPPAAAGAALSAGVAFALSLIVGFATGMDPDLPVGAAAFGLVVGSGVVAYRHTRSKLNRGCYDLVLDSAFRTVTLPATFERKAPLSVPFERISGAEVEEVWPKNRDSESTPSFAATLVLADSQRERLDEWGDREQAERFAAWLSEQLGLKPPPPAAG